MIPRPGHVVIDPLEALAVGLAVSAVLEKSGQKFHPQGLLALYIAFLTNVEGVTDAEILSAVQTQLDFTRESDRLPESEEP